MFSGPEKPQAPKSNGMSVRNASVYRVKRIHTFQAFRSLKEASGFLMKHKDGKLRVRKYGEDTFYTVTYSKSR
jgi:hypothetical protein